MKKFTSLLLFCVSVCFLVGCGEDNLISKVKESSLYARGGEPTYGKILSDYKFCQNGKWSLGKNTKGEEYVQWEAEYDKEAMVHALLSSGGNPLTRDWNVQAILNSTKPFYLVFHFYPPSGNEKRMLLNISWHMPDGEKREGIAYYRNGPGLFFKSMEKNEMLPRGALPEHF